MDGLDVNGDRLDVNGHAHRRREESIEGVLEKRSGYDRRLSRRQRAAAAAAAAAEGGGRSQPPAAGGGCWCASMSDDEGAFVWGGGAGAGDSDSDDDDDGDGDFSNPAQLGGDGDDDGAFVWGGGGGGGGSSDDSDIDDGERSDSDEGRAAEPQSSLDLLGSLLAGADMTDAIRQPEPEPEPQAAPKKRNKRAGEVRSPTAPPARTAQCPRDLSALMRASPRCCPTRFCRKRTQSR